MKNIILRLATISDAETVFEWRNDLETRKYSLDPRPLVYEEHRKWFKQSLKSHNRHLLIAEQDKLPIGVIRYDTNELEAEISIFLNPKLRSKGLGTQMLIMGADWIKEKLPQIKALRAKVLTENIASTKAFEKAGFISKIQLYEKLLK